MKKIRIITALTLVMLMLVSLASCGGGSGSGSEATLTGSWKYTMNLRNIVDEAMKSSNIDSSQADMMDKLMACYDDVSMDLILTFNDDGTFKSEISEESLENALEKVKDNMKSVLPDILSEMYNIDSSMLEKVLETQGVTLDEYIDKIMEQQDLSKMAGKSNGKYRSEGNKLYMTNDGKDEDTSKYIVYELDGDTFTITEVAGSSGSEISQAFQDFLLPMEFTRV